MAALMTVDEVGVAWRAAVARMQEGRRNEYRSYTRAEQLRAELDGRTLPRLDLNAPEFRGPRTLAEFLDDRVIERGRLAGMPETPLLVTIAEAARGGAEAAVRVVRLARQLEPRIQLVVYRNLEIWRASGDADATGARGLVAAVLAEWSRFRLPDREPDE
jgi:hypothetical protein